MFGRFLKGILFLLSIVLLLAGLLLTLIVIPYQMAYAKKVYPGVYIGKVHLGNKTLREAYEILETYLGEKSNYPITVDIENSRFFFSQEELGFVFSPLDSTQKAFAVGRTGNLIVDLKVKISSFRSGVFLTPSYKPNEEKFSAAFSDLVEKFESDPVEATFVYLENNLIITPSSSGSEIDQVKLKGKVIENLQKFNFNSIVAIKKEVPPKVSQADLQTIKDKVSFLLQQPPVITFGEQIRSLTAEQILTFLDFEKVDNEIKASVNEGNLKAFITTLSEQINKEPSSGVFQMEEERVVAFKLPEEGLKLNEEKTEELLSAALQNPINIKWIAGYKTPQDPIKLPVETTNLPSPAIEYGIKDLLGEGTTNFKGSSKSRIHNIGLSSSRISGTLVPPGETFSFNNTVGEISLKTGYDQAYIIRDRKTVLGTGGGVCQVSTTLFRSAFNAGLPIVERYPHSYRVFYYEPPVGFDATVYAPYTDLKFKNDTPAHILIFTYFKAGTYTLTFKIFGTKDGREVKIDGPFIDGQTPAPEPLYMEDSSLPPGEVKQIDFEATGAKVTVKRTVKRNGEILIDETLRSLYSPWRAVYLVGVED